MSSEKFYVMYFIGDNICHANVSGYSYKEAVEFKARLESKDSKHEYVIVHEAYLSEKDLIMPPSYYGTKDETPSTDDPS